MSPERSSSVGVDRNNYGLSPLELQIIALLAAGYTRKESAGRIGVTKHTFQHELKNLLDKLRVSNRLELVLFALHYRLIEDVQVPPLKAA